MTEISLIEEYSTIILITSGLIFAVCCFILFTYFYNRIRKSCGANQSCILDCEKSGVDFDVDSNNSLLGRGDASIRDMTLSSGSGAGQPKLVQQTIARQLEKVLIIGRGRYGQVFKAKWRDEYVAVKIFATTEEASWLREADMYETPLLQHNNILGFIAADILGTGAVTEMLLVTDYHSNGSLHDYLSMKVLDEESALLLMHTACAGLCHLHTEIFGKNTKPAIAHRDIKSKNILVKRSGECVIADLGLSVRYESSKQTIDNPPNNRVGTLRYMAPEILNESIRLDIFDSFKAADMYSFSLVLWEIARRCLFDNEVDEYQVPYYNLVPNDPSFEDMRKVVGACEMRPVLPSRWFKSYYLELVAKIMSEGWHQNASVRPTSLRMKKALSRIYLQVIENDKKPYKAITKE